MFIIKFGRFFFPASIGVYKHDADKVTTLWFSVKFTAEKIKVNGIDKLTASMSLSDIKIDISFFLYSYIYLCDGVKFCTIVHIGPGIFFSPFMGDTPRDP